LLLEIKVKMTEPTDALFNPGEFTEIDGPSISARSTQFNTGHTRISLKQWKMFHAVIDFDGFAEAANQLHVSQSSISHALAKLQEQLGVPLLTLKGRKAQITEEGKMLLLRSRDLVRNAIELEELAESLRQGWGPEIRLAIAPSFPSDLLMLALHELSLSPKKVRLHVKDATLEQAKQALHDNTVDLVISTTPISGFVGKKLIEIEHVAVAHPDNPLFALEREITFDELKTQFQIAISGVNDDVPADINYRTPQYPRPWKVSSLDRAIGALCHGVGYAWLPKYRVQRWLDGNNIRILPLNSGSSYKTNLYLVFGRSVTADSGTKRFADALQSCSERQSQRFEAEIYRQRSRGRADLVGCR
jgi:DNA-binding transcriptional LysR family regulator